MAVLTTKGFAVRCLHCGQEESIRIDAHDLHNFTCSSCDAEFTADDVRAEMARWGKLLAWLDSAPAID
jgi:transcription elongation factor Elf1